MAEVLSRAISVASSGLNQEFARDSDENHQRVKNGIHIPATPFNVGAPCPAVNTRAVTSAGHAAMPEV